VFAREQGLPSFSDFFYNGFAFVIYDSVQIGETVLHTGQVGWHYRPSGDGTSVLHAVDGRIRN